MVPLDDSISLTPEEFELAVKGMLDAAAGILVKYESKHLESIAAPDGEYIIDVTARSEALGANFIVLVECKHHKRKIERQDVQILHAKLQSIGAQKGMLFSIAGFQSGAIDYAAAHGIALIKMGAGSSSWFTRSAGPQTLPPSWANFPKYVGWWYHGSSISLISDDHIENTCQALGISQKELQQDV